MQLHQDSREDDDEETCLTPAGQASLLAYTKHGVRFRFPSDWTLTEQTSEDEITISLQSDGTSFWTLMLFPSRPDPEEVLETVVAAFEQDYEEVDVTSAIDNLGGLQTLGRDIDFVCYDLVNSATVRAFQTSDLTVMILYQGTDHELKQTRERLLAITASLGCHDDDDEP